MKTTFNAIIILIFAGLGPLSGAQVFGGRHPAPSPDGSEIAFSYHGDIWIVPAAGGNARRLTANPAYDSRPYWSPDGRTIAFMTDRWGNDDICIIPADGQEAPERLTFYSNYDLIYGWQPDGKSVIFSSQRYTIRPTLYSISVGGGDAHTILPFEAYNPCILPDGKTVYYERGGAAWWRRRYKGGANQNIYRKVLPEGISERITDYEGRDAYPMYSALDSTLYFISDRGPDTVSNIWHMGLDGKEPKQLTFEREDIHFPRISYDGSLITYECLHEICVYDVRTGRSRKIQISVNEDYTTEPFTFETFAAEASEFAISPNEKELAFVVRGDIFVMEIKEGSPGKIVRVTRTPYIEKDVAWHPYEEMLIYAALKDGDMDIFSIVPQNEKKFHEDLVFTTRKILDTKNTEYRPTFSPDGNLISYLQNHGELHVMSKDGNGQKKLCKENDVLWIDWSPDSRWIAFSRTMLGWREDVYVVPASGGQKPVNISNHPNDDYKPMWSQDGRRISFASRDAIGNLWMKYVFLLKEDEEKDMEYWEKGSSDTVVVAANVFIDFENIGERIHTVTQVRGGYNRVAQSPDGRQYAMHSDNHGSDDIWTVDWLGKELKRVTHTNVDPKMFFVSSDHSRIMYLSRQGQIFSADIATTKAQPLNFRVEIGIDAQIQRQQVFKEAWWSLQDGFYDSNFHGVDWPEMSKKYGDWASRTRETRDLHDVIRLMMGELNASHLGIWKKMPPGERSGSIGIVPDPDFTDAGIKVKAVISNTPATRTDVNIKPGEILTSVNGEPIDRGENLYKVLRNKNNEDIILKIEGRDKSRIVKLTCEDPSSILNTVNENWVKANKEYVHDRSKGKVGYVYIESMNEKNLRRFEKDLYEEMNKDGLIIDIRYNGGGSIHDELLNILRRTAYAYSIERDGEKSYSSLFRWDKPTVLLINEYCYSDAEIFPAGFKELELGTVIGVPTFGAVIGTIDIQLHEGTFFRVPTTGWYLLNGVNLENTPVQPDIFVENPPEQDGSSSDEQLSAALELLLR